MLILLLNIKKHYYFVAPIETVSMKINIYPLLNLILLFATTLGTQAQVKKTIQPVFNPDEQFEFKNTIVTEVFDGKLPTVKQAFSYTLALNIIGNDASGKVMVRAQYIKQNDRTEDLVKKEITGYNSDAPEALINASKIAAVRSTNQHYKEFNGAMLKKPFTIYIEELSGSVEVTGIDTLVTEALKNVSISDAAYLDGFSQGVRSVCNNEAMKGTLEAALNYLPGKPVGTGDGWTKNIQVEGTNLKLGYMVKSVQPDSIGVMAIASAVENSEYHVTVSKKGNLTIDGKTGLPIRSVMQSEIKSAPGSGGKFLMIKTERNELARVKKKNPRIT